MTPEKLKNFLAERSINTVGRLSLLLYVTNRLSELSHPYSVSEIVTKKGGQISGLSGNSVRRILAENEVIVSDDFIGEGGRTNRGSVGEAEQFIEWLNSEFAANAFDSGALRLIERELATTIALVIDEQKRILYLLPTSDPDYVGPRFVVTNEGLSLDPEQKSPDVPTHILNELRRMVKALVVDLGTTSNCYHSLRSCLSRYEEEIDRPLGSLRIPVLYAIGTELQNFLNAFATIKSDDPPLSADRAANFQSVRALHGVLIASTDVGRRLLEAAALFDAQPVDVEEFKRASKELVLRGHEAGLIAKKSAYFLVATSDVAGDGPKPERATHIAATTQRNAWSTMIQWCAVLAIEQSLSNSGYGKELFCHGGQIFDIAIDFFRAHFYDFAALANSAVHLLGWLPKVLEWLLEKLMTQ